MAKLRMKRGIFRKLIICYVLFAILLTFSYFACLVLSAVVISAGKIDRMYPYNVVNESGELVGLTYVERMGGWVERLNDSYEVVEVYGSKKTENTVYSDRELFELTSVEPSESREYVGFINMAENQSELYLILYPEDMIKLTATLIINGDNGYGMNRWAYLYMGLFGLFFVLNCVLFSLYLRKKIKNPLNKLITGMEAIKLGNDDVYMDFETESEFEQIRDTFNTMAKQLRTTRQEKQEIQRKKDRLILELSHDIKTPVATIKSCANALQAGLVAEDQIQDYYDTIEKKADRITQLSEDMFMLLKMENTDYKLSKEETDVNELLRTICAEYYMEITEAGFEFEIEIPEESCMLKLDERFFARVIINLLSNAGKYNTAGQMIGISAGISDKVYVIDVTDDGERIAPENEKRLFDAFSRGDKARKSDGGTGLGLSIAKAIVEKHGGDLSYMWMEGQNCFRIQIPQDT